MDYLDGKIKELEAYLPPVTKRPDFDVFWEETLRITKANPLRPELVKVDYPSAYVDVYEISYSGFDETRIYGWYIVPSFLKKDKYPCLVQYHGFGGDRGMASDHMQWALMGMAVISVDCREQGGITGNAAVYSRSGQITNVVSKGILNPDEYYYRAVYMDCVKALDFAESRPEVDASRLVIRGGSQGGALGMAVCALDDRPRAGLVSVPGNSNLEARVEGRHGSFAAVNDYLCRYPQHTEQVYATLSYFDTMNMSDRISCPMYASVGLADSVCPAKCYYASYNRIASPKRIEVYPFNEHDGAHWIQREKEMTYLRELGITE